MLTTYSKLEDVPEALREHYELSGGKYIPKVSDDHPLVVNNTKLLNEKNTAETKVAGIQTELESTKADLASAKAGSLPRGQRAVSVADAEFLEQVKAHGTPAEVTAKLTEHKTLKEETDQRKRQDTLREVAKELNYEPEAFIRLSGLPEFEVREKDGKKTVIAKVKEGANIVEKPAHEFIESSADIAPFLPALKVSGGGIRLPEQRREAGAPPANVFDKAREAVKTAEKNAIPPSAVEQRFGIAKTA
jgi:hypothetical protein